MPSNDPLLQAVLGGFLGFSVGVHHDRGSLGNRFARYFRHLKNAGKSAAKTTRTITSLHEDLGQGTTKISDLRC